MSENPSMNLTAGMVSGARSLFSFNSGLALARRSGLNCALLAIPLLVAPVLQAQQNTPHIGYVYPAGGQTGSTIQIVVGGQFLGNVSSAIVSGQGAETKIVEYNRPLNQKEFNDLRMRLRELQDKRLAARRFTGSTNAWTAADEKEITGITGRILKNPPNRQGNPAIAETVTVRVTLATNAGAGEREIRLGAPNGLSNPLAFRVGSLPEISKPPAQVPNPALQPLLERLGKPTVPAQSESRVTLPAIVNGQIMPGSVDRFRFTARKGQQLVAIVSARELIPYLADAVPGWFQATLALHDAQGKELAYEDDFRFHPDPVLHFEIPRGGDYTLEIKDAIYRGREDFVYRIAVGELPFVTSVFPLGGPAGTSTTVELTGWNLGATNRMQEVKFAEPGIHEFPVSNDDRVSNRVPFDVDTLPECREQEPNNSPDKAQHLTLPIIVNGRIDQPGDTDVFSFEGRAGNEIVAEVKARRLNSPLDSLLRLTDAAGKQIAFNDDTEDKGEGLETHHADSYLRVTLPADGTFYLHLGDTQRKGGAEYGYRLRLSAPRPDFTLRVVPSSVSVRGGASAPLTVYAFRRDGFTNAIMLELKNAPEGFRLSGAQVPANQDHVRFTLAAPPTLPSRPASVLSTTLELERAIPGPEGNNAMRSSSPAQTPGLLEPLASCPIVLEGWAIIDGQPRFRPAVPAEDMLQAFAYRHLVPSRELEVAVGGRGMPPLRILGATPVKLPAGGTVRVRLGPAGPRFTSNFQLELSEPPEGVTLKSVSPTGAGVELELAASGKVKPGLRDNLIVNAFGARPQQPSGRGALPNNRRSPQGTLPAIPFEIVPE